MSGSCWGSRREQLALFLFGPTLSKLPLVFKENCGGFCKAKAFITSRSLSSRGAVKVYTKAFQKVPLMRKKHGEKTYEYGYVWITLPSEVAGKPAIVKVYVLEEEPVEEKPLAPLPAKTPALEPQPEQRPQPAQPAPPAPIRPLPPALPAPAQPLQPLVPLQRERLSPELELLRALRPQPEREPQLRDLPPFEEFTLEPEEEGKRKRKWLRWP